MPSAAASRDSLCHASLEVTCVCARACGGFSSSCCMQVAQQHAQRDMETDRAASRNSSTKTALPPSVSSVFLEPCMGCSAYN